MVPALALLLADGRFPGGGHAHSGGLEAAVARGTVHDGVTLRAFLEARLRTNGVVEAWLAAAACAGHEPIRLEQECDARCVSPALRAAARMQGRGLRRAAARCWPELAEVTVEQHPVVVGLAARAAGLDAQAAAAVALHALMAGGASAAVRLLAIDMADAAAVAASLAPLADELAAAAAAHATSNETLDGGPAWSAPALELRAEDHARWEVRLFAS